MEKFFTHRIRFLATFALFWAVFYQQGYGQTFCSTPSYYYNASASSSYNCATGYLTVNCSYTKNSSSYANANSVRVQIASGSPTAYLQTGYYCNTACQNCTGSISGGYLHYNSSSSFNAGTNTTVSQNIYVGNWSPGYYTLVLRVGNSNVVGGHSAYVWAGSFTVASAINLPAPSVSSSSCNSNNGSISASASGGCGNSYQYKLNNGGWQNSGYFPNLYAGSYTIYAKDGAGNTTSYSTTIYNNGSPVSIYSQPTGTSTACNNYNLSVGTNNASTCTWYLNGSPVGNGFNFTANQSGSYKCYVSNSTCGGIYSNTIVVTINSSPTAAFSLNANILTSGQALSLTNNSLGFFSNITWEYINRLNTTTNTSNNNAGSFSTTYGQRRAKLTVSGLCGTSVAPQQNVKVKPDLSISRPNKSIVGKQPEVADPIGVITGGLAHREEDLTLMTKVGEMPFVRSYFSDYNTINGSFGYGWQSPFDYWIEFVNVDLWVVHHAEGHLTYHVPYDGGETLPLYQGIEDSLYQNTGNGTYTMRKKDGTLFNFGTNGKLNSVIDLNGNQILLTYLGGNLVTVTFPGGRAYSLGYNANGKIASVSNGLYTYNYLYSAAEDLTSASDGVHTMQYVYDNQHRILNIIDCKGTTFLTNQYDAVGRVFKQWDSYGFMTQLTYSSGNTVVTYPDNSTQIYYFDSNFRTYKVTDEVGASIEFTFNAKHYPLSFKDQRNYTYNFLPDSKGNLTSVTNPLGNSQTATFNALNLPLTLTDVLSHAVNIQYSPSGNPINMTYPNTGLVAITYTASGQIWQVTNQKGQITTYNYLANGDLSSIVSPTATYSFTYDAIGRPISIQSNGKTWTVQWNIFGQWTQITDPMNFTLQRTFDLNGNVIGEKDKVGTWTYFAWDNKDRMTTTTDALNHVTTFAYNNMDRITSITDARGIVVLQYTYYLDGQIDTEITPLGTTKYFYDPAKNVTKIRDAMNQEYLFTYDALNRLLTATDPLFHSVTYTYNALSQVTDIQYPDNTHRQYFYNNMNWLAKTKDALNQESNFTYDIMGLPKTVVDALGHTLSNTIYDNTNRPITVQTPLGNYQYSWTVAGNLLSSTEPNGLTSTYTRNNNDEITGIAYNNGQSESFVRNANGEILDMTNQNGTTSYNRNALGWIMGKTDNFGNQTQYHRSAVGVVDKINYPSGKIIDYIINNANLMTQVKEGTNTLATFGYNANGLQVSEIFGNNTSSQTTRNAIGQITKKLNYLPNNNVVNKDSLAYDVMGRVVYNNTTQHPLYPNYTPTNFTNAYGNMNQTSNLGGATVANDANGNRLNVGGASNSQTFIQNNMVSSFTRSGTTTQLGYDAAMQKIKSITNGVETRFVNDNIVADLPTIIEERSATNTLQATYILGPGGQPIAREVNGSKQYYGFDAFGNTKTLTNTSGTITDKYACDIFGDFENHFGSTNQPFQFLGKYGIEHLTQGLYNHRARLFDAPTGMFLSTDAYPSDRSNTQGLNAFTYGLNSPMTFMDVDGMKPQKMVSQVRNMSNDANDVWFPVDFLVSTLEAKNKFISFYKWMPRIWDNNFLGNKSVPTSLINNSKMGMSSLGTISTTLSILSIASSESISEAVFKSGILGASRIPLIGPGVSLYFSPLNVGEAGDDNWQLLEDLRNAKVSDFPKPYCLPEEKPSMTKTTMSNPKPTPKSQSTQTVYKGYEPTHGGIAPMPPSLTPISNIPAQTQQYGPRKPAPIQFLSPAKKP